MLKERLAAARAVETAFVPAEEAADEAFQRIAALLVAMNAARMSAHLPMQTGRTETNHIATAIQHASAMRDHILAAHAELVMTRSTVLPAFAVGDNGECPGGIGEKSSASLRAVS